MLLLSTSDCSEKAIGKNTPWKMVKLERKFLVPVLHGSSNLLGSLYASSFLLWLFLIGPDLSKWAVYCLIVQEIYKVTLIFHFFNFSLADPIRRYSLFKTYRNLAELQYVFKNWKFVNFNTFLSYLEVNLKHKFL